MEELQNIYKDTYEEDSEFAKIINDYYSQKEIKNKLNSNSFKVLIGKRENINGIKNNDLCPCGSKKKYKKCCKNICDEIQKML